MTIPTAITNMAGGITQWARETFSSGTTGRLSTKRHVVVLASCVLMVIALWITKAIYIRIRWFGEVGDGAVWAFGIAIGTVAALAGIVYKKPDPPAAPPDKEGE